MRIDLIDIMEKGRKFRAGDILNLYNLIEILHTGMGGKSEHSIKFKARYFCDDLNLTAKGVSRIIGVGNEIFPNLFTHSRVLDRKTNGGEYYWQYNKSFELW